MAVTPVSELPLPPSSEAAITALRNLASPNNPHPDILTHEAGALFARLKALNRAATFAVRERKQRTTDARLAMDQTHLQLQNLMYEKRHFEREIEKCQQFGSIHQDVPLHTLEEFLELAPPEARTEEVLRDERQLMLNRLNFELTERQRLDELKKQLTKRKEELLREDKEYQAKVDAFGVQLEALTKSVVDLQKKSNELAAPFLPEQTSTDSSQKYRIPPAD